MVYRIYVEKKPGLDQEARAIENDLRKLLELEGISRFDGRDDQFFKGIAIQKAALQFF